MTDILDAMRRTREAMVEEWFNPKPYEHQIIVNPSEAAWLRENNAYEHAFVEMAAKFPRDES